MSASLSSTSKRQFRVRNKIKQNNRGQRAKVSVFRSNKNIYAQLIDVSGKVLHSFSSTILDEKELKGAKGLDIAKLVGSKFAKGCVEKGVVEVVFDKGSYQYGGRVKALAESCREDGLKF
jgi:large subunit ribosomal protein L18